MSVDVSCKWFQLGGYIVWSPHDDLYIERVLLDQGFIEEKLKKAERLFRLAIIPELLGKWFTRGNTQLPDMISTTDDLHEDADKLVKMMMMMDHGVTVSNQEGMLWLDVTIPPVKLSGFTWHAYTLAKHLKENGAVPVATFLI